MTSFSEGLKIGQEPHWMMVLYSQAAGWRCRKELWAPDCTNRPVKSASSISTCGPQRFGDDQQQVHLLLQCLQHVTHSSGPQSLSTCLSSPCLLSLNYVCLLFFYILLSVSLLSRVSPITPVKKTGYCSCGHGMAIGSWRGRNTFSGQWDSLLAVAAVESGALFSQVTLL